MRARWLLAAVLAAALLFGTWFRVSGLDRKILWYDEAATYLTLTGHTKGDVQALYDGRPLRAADLRAFVAPEAVASSPAVVRALIDHEPHNPPAYYLLARAGARWFGASGPRAVSAIVSVAALIVMGLLARAVFGDARAGWLAAALAAVSPFHVRYGQEARSYALWSIMVMAASFLLLRAVRNGRWRDCGVYALAAAAALYTHLLSVLVLLAHAIFVGLPITMSAGRRSRLALAFAGALLAFAPWAAIIFVHRDTSRSETAWTMASMSWSELGHRWIGINTTVFLRSGAEGGLFGPSSEPPVVLARLALSVSIAALVVVSGYVLVRETTRDAWLFVALLGAVPALGLALPDLLWGGRRSMVPRFLVPCWIALELWVAGALAQRMRRQDPRAVAVALALMVAGAGSVWGAAPLRTWWDTSPHDLKAIDEAARQINVAADPVVQSDASPLWVLQLARELRGDVRLQLGTAVDIGHVRAERSLFVYSPSSRLLTIARGARPDLHLCVHSPEVALWCTGR